MSIYQQNHQKSLIFFQKFQKICKWISFFRLLSIVSSVYFGYLFFSENNILNIFLSVFLFGFFFVLIKLHQYYSEKEIYFKTLSEINQKEDDFLKNNIGFLSDGKEFSTINHPYSNDLDIFGPQSLFHYLNRCYTYIGQKFLAKSLQNGLENEDILQNQEAIKELTEKLDFRQDFMTLAKMSNDDISYEKRLNQWMDFVQNSFSKKSLILIYSLNFSFICTFIVLLFEKSALVLEILGILFVIQLNFTGFFYKKMMLEISDATKTDVILKHYSKLFSAIEKETFKSEKLQRLQQKLFVQKQKSSKAIAQISGLLEKMDTLQNGVVALIFNGTILYHLHIFRKIQLWKTENRTAFGDWLETLSEIDALQSLANFSFNNPKNCYPKLNSDNKISFINMVHPLLSSKNGVPNSIDFSEKQFVILTGSNMSGKSTFLRTLGVQWVLAQMGSVVSATEAHFSPMPLWASMRLTDSLTEKESYFFAEIKRLKEIMSCVENQTTFVLLDEILRGTNSEDKQGGTIAIVQKMVEKKALGVLATHDLDVCLETGKNPDFLTNKCFEVEIKENDLHFDFKLRDGICKNKSATFLMKKMGVI